MKRARRLAFATGLALAQVAWAVEDAPQAPQPSTKRAQSIDFKRVSPRVYPDPDFRLDASATSGLRVSFTATGDCTVDGSTVQILSAGKCRVTARQPGDSRFEAAPDVEQVIPIAKADQTIDFPELSDAYYSPYDRPLTRARPRISRSCSAPRVRARSSVPP